MSLFVTIEGGEGGGKSTNLAYIEKYLKDKGNDVVVTREPGGTALGEKLRNILLDPGNEGMDERAELLLMFSARAHHIAKVIKPALAAGKTVLCDRFTDATYAYQGGGRGLSVEDIAVLEDWVQGDLRPDLTILLDIDVNVGLQRAGQRGDKDRFEQEEIKFFDRVRNSYLQMAKEQPKRYRVIDAGEPLETVQKQLHQVLDLIFEVDL